MTIDSKVQTTEEGLFINLVKALDKSTIQHASEIMNDRRKDILVNGDFHGKREYHMEMVQTPYKLGNRYTHEFRPIYHNDPNLYDYSMWTADLPVYTIENGAVVMYLADREHNPILNSIMASTTEIDEKYFLKKSEIEAIAQAKSTLKIKLSDLRLKLLGDDFTRDPRGIFEINTKGYCTLNKTQRMLAERVYGTGQDYNDNMKMLSDHNIRYATIVVFSPEKVKNSLKYRRDKQSKGFAVIPLLNSFEGESRFCAGYSYESHGLFYISYSINNSLAHLRGVLINKDYPK